ncbi:hypothetical protein ACMU_10580 [Actibacterium mucosum KCTC 23349]|uniref:N-acetyltransferase domain-containing protein n=1 Tax=Actibacterium mucosum KCTC 23349 TaxID=1454373 RepID=A0A037ZKM0_9RHOB|nr:GNAT family protein [Actibacterium mucosum]KAJ56189.1 hypothetical protein ACMU_10580 [Actibacterium mucosum KCTC 23349]
MPNQQKLGAVVDGWTPPPRPGPDLLQGQYVRLERLNAASHAADLFNAFAPGGDPLWTYMHVGPFHSAAQFHRWAAQAAAAEDPFFYAICDTKTGRALGQAALMRIDPAAGSIEVGSITYGPALQQTPAATEAMMLMMQWAFGAGYRRYEWKCNALNLPSRRAAQRLGFSYEGVFRQAMVSKGRNRDTAWFAVIDSEWPALKAAYDAWLAPSNFAANGAQAERLSDLTGLVRVASDPAL